MPVARTVRRACRCKSPADHQKLWFQKGQRPDGRWHPICKIEKVSACPILFVRSEAEINAAIRDCLDSFEPGRSAIAHLASHLDRLRRDSWTDAEISQVEIGARRILTKLIYEEGDEES